MTTIGNATISHPRDFAQAEYVWPSSSGSVYIIIFIKTVIWKKIIDLIEYYRCFPGNCSKQHQLQYWFFWISLSMRMESITLFTNKLTAITRRETNFQHISQYFVGLFPSMANMLSENLLYPRREKKVINLLQKVFYIFRETNILIIHQIMLYIWNAVRKIIRSFSHRFEILLKKIKCTILEKNKLLNKIIPS